MNRIKKIIIKVLRLKPIVVFDKQPIGIDTDKDYRRTGKTTMRLRAAYNHLNRDPSHKVVFVVSYERRVTQIERKAMSMYPPEYLNRFMVITPRTQLVGRDYTKVIYDLEVIYDLGGGDFGEEDSVEKYRPLET